MGINQLFNIVITGNGPYAGKTIGSLGREISLSVLSGTRICIDASGIIYSSILAMAEITSLSSGGETTAHMNTILNKVLQLNKYSVQQIWVFDSPTPNPLKQRELESRKKRRDESSDPRVQFKMTSKHVEDVRKMLIHLGVMTIIAPPGIEAEQYCAWMTQSTDETPAFCRYALSGDSDVLAFGGNLLKPIKVKSASGKSSKTSYMAYDIQVILEAIQLDYRLFVKMCVVMGTDFNEKTPRVGIKTVMSKITNYSIVLTPEQITSQNHFMNTQIEEAEMTCEPYSETELCDYLNRFGFNTNRIKTLLKDYAPAN